MVRFAAGAPKLAGLKWRQGHAPTYFSNGFEGKLQSKNVIHSMFNFISRVIRKDLYENRSASSLQECTSREPFTSKRSDLFFEPKKHVLARQASLKQSVAANELVKRTGLDPFTFKVKLYYEDEQQF